METAGAGAGPLLSTANGKATMKHMQSVLKTEHNVPDRDMQKLRQAQLVKMVSLTALALLSNRT